MIGSSLSFMTPSQVEELKSKVLELLAGHGVKLDPHPGLFKAMKAAGIEVDEATGLVKFPQAVMKELLAQAPGGFSLGARGEGRALELPRPGGGFYARTGTGAHGWIDPASGAYRKIKLADLAAWAELINHLDEISFLPFLFCDDPPTASVDVHCLSTVLTNCDKHAWVQPYSAQSVEWLFKLGAAAAGGASKLTANPVISVIACSLTPRAFKQMDLEIIYRAALAGVPIQACSLPGAGGTAPATLPGVILLAAAEILAMTAMAQAVMPGAPVVACPIIFSTDMATGRSLQSSSEGMKAAAGAVQFIKAAFGLPTHNYGTGADSPLPDHQSMSERALLTMLMAASGSDILGGAGQLEVATSVSPLQLIIDNEVLGMVRRAVSGFEFSEDQLAWDLITSTAPGQHFLTARHTLKHCRDAEQPLNFSRQARDQWEKTGSRDLMDRVRDDYNALTARENTCLASEELTAEMKDIVAAADKDLTG